MPALQASYEQLRDEGFVIIGVNLTDNELAQGRTEDDIREFSQQYGITYPIALDMEGEVATAYRLFPLPTSYFVDAQGRIRYIRVGELTLEDVTTIFARLQQESVALRQ
jgi:alkyl hydroperoxide reductase subunit AhpC